MKFEPSVVPQSRRAEETAQPPVLHLNRSNGGRGTQEIADAEWPECGAAETFTHTEVRSLRSSPNLSVPRSSYLSPTPALSFGAKLRASWGEQTNLGRYELTPSE